MVGNKRRLEVYFFSSNREPQTLYLKYFPFALQLKALKALHTLGTYLLTSVAKEGISFTLVGIAVYFSSHFRPGNG